MLVSYTSIGLLSVLASLVQGRYIGPSSQLARRAEVSQCINSHSTFKNSLDDWTVESGITDANYGFTNDGLEMRILPPAEYVPLMDKNVDPRK